MRASLATELREVIAAAAGGREPAPELRFHRHDQYRCYGLKTANLRAIWRQHRERIRALPMPDRLAMADELVALDIGELSHTGVHLLALSTAQLEVEHLEVVDRMLDRFRSWSLVDHLCGDVLQPLLARFPAPVLEQSQTWSRATSRWKRRASVVVFTRKATRDGAHLEHALDLCRRLAFDPADIVQKGVGWALKDSLRWTPDVVLPIVKELRRAGAPSTVVLYAIRNLEGAARDEVLAIPRPGGRRKA
jgi:3-methyladenine DNA glycosylase AlkD